MTGIHLMRRAIRRRNMPVLPPPDPYGEAIMADLPLLYLPMGGTDGLVDRSGRGHTVTAIGGPTQATWIDGTTRAMAFNGATSYAQVANAADLSVTSTGLTYELWMSPSALEFPNHQGTGDYAHLLGKGDTGVNEYVLRMYPASYTERSCRVSGYLFIPGGGLGTGSYRQRPIAVNEWLHVMVEMETTTINAAYTSTSAPGTIRIYVNGVLFDIDPLINYDTVPVHGPDPLRLGAAPGTPDSFWPGRLSQVAMYDHLLGAQTAMSRYRLMVPLQTGVGGLVRQLGQVTATGSGTTLQTTVSGAATAAGNTVFVGIFADYTSSAAVVTDAKGGTWLRDHTVPITGNSSRLSLYRRTAGAALVDTDWIRGTWSVSLGHRAMVAAEVSGLVDNAAAYNASGTYNAKSTTDGWNAEADNDMTEVPMTHLTTTTARTIIVGLHGMQLPGSTTSALDDPEAWDLAGKAGTTGAGDFACRSLMMAVRSVPSAGEYTFAATYAAPGPWTAMAFAYPAVAP